MNVVRTYALKNNDGLLQASASHFSLKYDFLLKPTDEVNLHQTLDEFAFAWTFFENNNNQ